MVYPWMFTLPLVLLVACWGWLWLAARRGWDRPRGVADPAQIQPAQAGEQPSAPGEEQAGAGVPPQNHPPAPPPSKWGLALLLVIAFLLIFLLILAPPRLGGAIPIAPHEPGRPFYNLRWLREFARSQYEHFGLIISLAGNLAGVSLLFLAHLRRWRLAGELALALVSLTLAALGQWWLNQDLLVVGAALYAFAVIGFASWAWLARRRLRAELEPQPVTRRGREWLLLTGILALAAFARTYALQAVPYGVEGDESKWIYEVVRVMLDGRPDSSGEYHRDALPASFYMQAPFQRWLGTGILSARVGVVVYSLLGTLLFYWLARGLAPLPVAALATFLLSISVLDISASRLANVESHVKLWPILALALLLWAGRTRQWELYALSGIALAFGLLTYDTVWPMLAVILLLALIELLARRETLRAGSKQIAALIFPTLLILPILIPYFASRLAYYQIAEKGWNAGWWQALGQNLSLVLRSWFVAANFDFIYNRPGPQINALLLPLLALGVVVALFTLRQQFARWMLLWAVLIALPVPVLTASAFSRVYYPGLPAIYGLIALGIYGLGRELGRLLGPNLVALGKALGIVALVWLPLFNFYIYFNEVGDPPDRQIRREIGELVLTGMKAGDYLYLPYFSGGNDPLEIEIQSVELNLRAHFPASQIPGMFERIPYGVFLPTLQANAGEHSRVVVLLDKTTTTQRVSRDLAHHALLRCFPGGRLRTGHFFDRYTLDAAVLAQPRCLPVTADLRPAANDAASLAWSLSAGSATSIQLACEQARADVIAVEAENFGPGPGWQRDVSFVSGWQGEGYLADNYGSQFARLNLSLPAANLPAYAWVRYFKRAVDASPAFVYLGNQALPFADISSEQLNQWLWERAGPFDSVGGIQEWKLARPYQEEASQFMAIFIDALIITTDPQFDPQNDSHWQASYEAAYPLPQPASQGNIPLDLPAGRYRCAITVASELALVDAYGQTPLRSEVIEIDIP